MLENAPSLTLERVPFPEFISTHSFGRVRIVRRYVGTVSSKLSLYIWKIQQFGQTMAVKRNLALSVGMFFHWLVGLGMTLALSLLKRLLVRNQRGDRKYCPLRVIRYRMSTGFQTTDGTNRFVVCGRGETAETIMHGRLVAALLSRSAHACLCCCIYKILPEARRKCSSPVAAL